MTYREDDEMSDDEIRQRFGKLIDEAALAFSVDTGYASDIARKARMILARRSKKAN